MRKACLDIHRCVTIIDIMAMHTLYGVMAFTEAELHEACRFLFDVFTFIRLLVVKRTDSQFFQSVRGRIACLAVTGLTVIR